MMDPLLDFDLGMDLTRYQTPARRQRLTLKQKVQVINFISRGGKKVEASKRFGISSSSISTLWKVRDSLLGRFHRRENGDSKANKKPPFLQLEDPLVDWVRSMKASGISLTGEHIRQRALEMADKMSMTGFTASTGWLSRFKKRNYKRLQLESEEEEVLAPLPQTEPEATPTSKLEKCPASNYAARNPRSQTTATSASSSSSRRRRFLDETGVFQLEKSLIELEMEHLAKMNALLRFHRIVFYLEADDTLFDGSGGSGGADVDVRLNEREEFPVKLENNWDDFGAEVNAVDAAAADAAVARKAASIPNASFDSFFKRSSKRKSLVGEGIEAKRPRVAPATGLAPAPSRPREKSVMAVVESLRKAAEPTTAAADSESEDGVRMSRDNGEREGGGGGVGGEDGCDSREPSSRLTLDEGCGRFGDRLGRTDERRSTTPSAK